MPRKLVSLPEGPRQTPWVAFSRSREPHPHPGRTFRLTNVPFWTTVEPENGGYPGHLGLKTVPRERQDVESSYPHSRPAGYVHCVRGHGRRHDDTGRASADRKPTARPDLCGAAGLRLDREQEDRVLQSRLPHRGGAGGDRAGHSGDRPRALRQFGHAHRTRDHPRAGGAALLRPGPALRLRVQPWRGGARVPQGAGDRSHLRHVLLGRGLGAGPEHQLSDAARCRGAGLRGDRPGHGAEAGRQRARAGADRRPERALCRRSRAPTARRWMPPMPTPWRTWRRGSRTTTRCSCCSRTR